MKKQSWNRLVFVSVLLILVFSFLASFSTFIVVDGLGSEFEENEYTKSYIENHGSFLGSFFPFFTTISVLFLLIFMRFFVKKMSAGKIRILLLVLVESIIFGFLIQRFLNSVNDFSLLLVLLNTSQILIPVSMNIQYVAFLLVSLIFALISYKINSIQKEDNA